MLQLPAEEGSMAGKENMYETFFKRTPGNDKLRKNAEGRLKFLLREGWHEMAREQASADTIRIRFERDGFPRPLPPLRRVPEPPPRRRPGERGGPGGPRGGPGFPRSGPPPQRT